MTKKTRTKLFLLFIAIFFIVTPAIAFYAAGYKVNLTWPLNFKHIIQKTGMLIIDTEPADARIYLNDEAEESLYKKYFSNEISYITTPAKIKNLLPGDYDIRLEIPGYWPWHKKLKIKSGESTFIENVYLFKKDIPQKIVNFSSLFSSQSPNNKNIALLNNNELNVIDSNENIKKFPINEKDVSNSILMWSNDNKKILVALANKNLLIKTDNNEVVDLNELLNVNINNLKWSESDSNIFYYTFNDRINSYNIVSKEIVTLISGEDFVDYLVKENNIYYISKINKVFNLKVYSRGQNNIIKIIDIPYSPDLKLINPSHKYLNLYDSKHEILYIIEPLSPRNPLREIITNINKSFWVNDEKLLYSNDFEIWYFDFNENKKELLTRISNPISSVIWHENNNYVIYSTDSSIFTIELDEREKRNINELLKFDSITFLYLNSKNDSLYLTGKIGNQEGLYKLAI